MTAPPVADKGLGDGEGPNIPCELVDWPSVSQPTVVLFWISRLSLSRHMRRRLQHVSGKLHPQDSAAQAASTILRGPTAGVGQLRTFRPVNPPAYSDDQQLDKRSQVSACDLALTMYKLSDCGCDPTTDEPPRPKKAPLVCLFFSFLFKGIGE